MRLTVTKSRREAPGQKKNEQSDADVVIVAKGLELVAPVVWQVVKFPLRHAVVDGNGPRHSPNDRERHERSGAPQNVLFLAREVEKPRRASVPAIQNGIARPSMQAVVCAPVACSRGPSRAREGMTKAPTANSLPESRPGERRVRMFMVFAGEGFSSTARAHRARPAHTR